MSRSYEHDLDGDKLSEIASELGCSKSRAKQIEKRALEKLRTALEAHGIVAEPVKRYLADRDACSRTDWSEDL